MDPALRSNGFLSWPRLAPKAHGARGTGAFLHADLVDLCSLYLLLPSLGRGSLFPCVCVGEVK